MNAILMPGGDRHPLRRQKHDITEPRFQQMRNGAVDLDLILGHDHGKGACGKAGGRTAEKVGKRGVAHGGSAWGAGRIGYPAGQCKGARLRGGLFSG